LDIEEYKKVDEIEETKQIVEKSGIEGRCANNHSLIKIHVKELGPLADEILGFVLVEDALQSVCSSCDRAVT